MRYLGLGLVIAGAVFGVVTGVGVFVVALVLAIVKPSLVLVALAGLAGVLTAFGAGFAVAGTLLPFRGRPMALVVLVFAALHFLIYLGAGAWPAALPAALFLFPGGVLLLPGDRS